MVPRPCQMYLVCSIGGQRNHGLLVNAAAHLPSLENLMLGNPLVRPLVHFLRVRLENEPLARPPAPRVHLGVETLRKFLLVVVGVKLRPEIDAGLCSAQRTKILANILR